jgi:hypothetical protein
LRRLAILVLVALAVSIVKVPEAVAGSVWDPNEPQSRLDIRWVGVVAQQDGRFRVTISFHHRVRFRWFGRDSGVVAAFTHDREIRPYWFFAFMRTRAGRLRAQLCEGGSGCGRSVRVSRPNAVTIRAWLDPLYNQPQVGWWFRAWSFRGGPSGTILDRTSYSTI